MANICLTDFVIVGYKDSLEKLQNFLKEVDSKAVEHTYTLYWALKDSNVKNYENIDTRASLVDATLVERKRRPLYTDDTDLRNFALIITTESAWTAPIDMMEKLIEILELEDDTSINLYAEEPGCDYYELRNPDRVFEINIKV